MSKVGKVAWGAMTRTLFTSSLLVLVITAAVVAFSFGFNGAQSVSLPGGPQTLIWVIAIAALTLLSLSLLLVGWLLRRRLFSPLESLRRSLIAAAAGGLSEPIWGLQRKDEVGALARSIERLRHSIAANEHNSALVLSQSIERLIKDAARLEADFARLSSATSRASEKIEEASIRAAKASHGAIEAADLTREGTQRIAVQAENNLAALIDMLKGVSHGDAPVPKTVIAQSDQDAETALDGLVGDLEALERFAQRRSTIESDEAVALNAALIEAIDRLNAVAERIAASADASQKKRRKPAA